MGFVSHRKDTKLLGRISSIILVFSGLSTVFAMNIMCSMVSTAAHKPYDMQYSIITKNIPMSFRQRWKLLLFIEKLSGPEIGFYCLDWFPMNSVMLFNYLSEAREWQEWQQFTELA